MAKWQNILGMARTTTTIDTSSFSAAIIESALLNIELKEANKMERFGRMQTRRVMLEAVRRDRLDTPNSGRYTADDYAKAQDNLRDAAEMYQVAVRRFKHALSNLRHLVVPVDSEPLPELIRRSRDDDYTKSIFDITVLCDEQREQRKEMIEGIPAPCHCAGCIEAHARFAV